MTSIKNQATSDGGLEQARRQVDEVQGIMKDNVDKVLEREGKLSQLEERADRLQEGTEQFHRAERRGEAILFRQRARTPTGGSHAWNTTR